MNQRRKRKTKKGSTSRGGGGHATAAGMAYQHAVAAWIAVQMLADGAVSPPWELPEDNTLDELKCETREPVDDIYVRTSARGHVFIQAKKTLNLGTRVDSDFFKAVDQCVRQFLSLRGGTSSLGRPVDARMDRFVLVVGPSSSRKIKEILPQLLARMRSGTTALSSLAVSKSEKEILETVLNHIRTSFRNNGMPTPSDNDMRGVLAPLHIQVLDALGNDDISACNELRRSIVEDETQASSAMAVIRKECENMAWLRAGIDRLGLQRVLLDKGFKLRAVRRYEQDIQRLRDHTEANLASINDVAALQCEGSAIRIKRHVVKHLHAEVLKQSLIVVGEPGSGKTVALYDLAMALKEEGHSVVYLRVDRLTFKNMAGLQTELGLDSDLDEVLNGWPSTQKSILIIDGLDAARDEYTAASFLEVIERVALRCESWNIVASIRDYDLRYRIDLRRLFGGHLTIPEMYCHRELNFLRHILIPLFSDDEIGEVIKCSVQIKTFVDGASQQLRSLLRVPFNLRLVCEMINEGVSLSELHPIRSEIELFDRFWLHRVICQNGIDDDGGDAREAILRRACEEMVRKRQLRAERSAITDSGGGRALRQLLSGKVLDEEQGNKPRREIICFSHHCLFDYAVARLLLRGVADVADFLVSDPVFFIVIRPSIERHLQYLWSASGDHHDFWQVTLDLIKRQDAPAIGKIIGPALVAELAKCMPDLEHLLRSLDGRDIGEREAAEKAVGYIIGAVDMRKTEAFPICGEDAGPWCAFAEHLSINLRKKTVYVLRRLLWILCENTERMTEEERIFAGVAARRFFSYVLTVPEYDPWLMIGAIKAVCRTFGSDRVESASILRHLLEEQRIASHGYEELPWLARELKPMIVFDPELAHDIYVAAFGYRESDKSTTSMHGSQILTLTSNRSQDYDFALYELAEVYPDFLTSSSLIATKALLKVVESYVAQEHSSAPGIDEEREFEINGLPARIRDDYSYIWDEGSTHSHDHPIKMLNSFDRYLEGLALNPKAVEQLKAIIDLVILQNPLAVIWRRLLLMGAKHPQTLGKHIKSFIWTKEILTARDTTVAAGELIRVLYPLLSKAERKRVEGTIMSIPEEVDKDRREGAEHVRNRLLGCLDRSCVVTMPVVELLDTLVEKGEVPENRPPFSHEVITEVYDEEKYFEEHGVPVESPANAQIIALEKKIDPFCEAFRNNPLSPDDARTVMPLLEELFRVLQSSAVNDIHEIVREHAAAKLAEACAIASKCDGLLSEERCVLRDILLLLSSDPSPPPRPEYDSQFDESPPWSKPAVRVEVVRGLMYLARCDSVYNDKIKVAIERLSVDPVPAVRFQVVSDLVCFYKTDNEFMWHLIQTFSDMDASCGVLYALINYSLCRLMWAHPNQIVVFAKKIMDRIHSGPGSDKVRRSAFGIIADLYLAKEHDECRVIVEGVLADPMNNSAEAHVLIKERSFFTRGPVEPADPEEDKMRLRMFGAASCIVRSCNEEYNKLCEAKKGLSFDQWTDDEQQQGKVIAELINDVVDQIYFASGAFDSKNAEPPLSRDVRERFYRESGKLIDDLSQVSHPRITHHLVETLESFIEFDPKGVFERIARVVISGSESGYQFESMATDLIVRIIERYLAEYRVVFQANDECNRMLIKVLDAFVEAGWPQAQRLTYRLGDIFR